MVWLATLDAPPMERADAMPWVTFLLKLNGQEGTFLLGDAAAKTPRGSALGTPVVSGGSQTGQTLVTGGWTASATGVLKAGDYIQIGQRLYMVLDDVSANGSGAATFDIFPKLRESPTNGTSIVTSNTVGLFRLASSDPDIYDVDRAKHYGISFSAVEAV